MRSGKRFFEIYDQNAGAHAAQWDASEMASGFYFYKLTAGDFLQMRKMMLVK